MPLSEKDRAERQVLRYLLFHERSPVVLRADAKTAREFECPDERFLLDLLTDMIYRNLFYIHPAPRAATPAAAKSRASAGEVLMGASVPADARRGLLEGVLAMITSGGKKRYQDLRSATSSLRQAEWLQREAAGEAGGWMRADGAP